MKILPLTRSPAILTTIFGHIEDVGSHKNARYEKVCVLKRICVLPEISAHHLQLNCMGDQCFLCHPNIENTAILCDSYINYCIKYITE